MAAASRQFDSFAQRRGLPVLSIHAGPVTRATWSDSLSTLELERSATTLELEVGFQFDPLLWRHIVRVVRAVRRFKPDLIHVTGPSDIGILGAYLAYHYDIPLVASWHSNLHEFAAWRLEAMLSFIPEPYRDFVSSLTERHALLGVTLFYRIARMLLAPNPDVQEMLRTHTHKDVYLVGRAVDTTLFHPAKRFRQDGAFTLGYAGRLRPEKNVRLLPTLAKALPDGNFKFVIIGEGPERKYLERHLRRVEFTGPLEGEALALAYANMDLFVFPSKTDCYGHAVREALASGVPVVCMQEGGPRFLVDAGVTGHVAINDRDFARGVCNLIDDPERHQHMRLAARQAACRTSWDAVFELTYEAYAQAMEGVRGLRRAG